MAISEQEWRAASWSAEQQAIMTSSAQEWRAASRSGEQRAGITSSKQKQQGGDGVSAGHINYLLCLAGN